jgi:hypothetical protein
VNTPTVKAESTPARAGTLGIQPLRAPSGINPAEIDRRIAVLEKRTGHELEMRGDEGFYFLFDWSCGDAAGEGRTREEALESAEENL